MNGQGYRVGTNLFSDMESDTEPLLNTKTVATSTSPPIYTPSFDMHILLGYGNAMCCFRYYLGMCFIVWLLEEDHRHHIDYLQLANDKIMDVQ